MLRLYLTGGELNTNPNQSLGAHIHTHTVVSNSEIINDVFNNLFDNIPLDEILHNQDSTVEYFRVVALKNITLDTTTNNIKIFFYDTTDYISETGDFTISYEMAPSKYKNLEAGFPDSTTICYCNTEYDLPVDYSECVGTDFKFYTEESPINVDVLLPEEYILLYIKRKLIVNELSDFTVSTHPIINQFKIRITWNEI